MISGLSPSLGRLVERVARAHDRTIVAAPAGPLGTFPPQELVPGASLAVTLSSGAVTAGAIGTVTYRDGSAVYGFGHGFDTAGRRALQLADAYVFTVVGNPLDTQDAVSYKLAAPGHPLGVLTNDAPAGVVGTLGGRPRTIPLTVTVRDLDRGTKLQQRTSIVDEGAVDNPSGDDLLSTIAPLAVAQGITTAFNGAPARESGVLCLRVRVREVKQPLHFCNRYVLNGVDRDRSAGPARLPDGHRRPARAGDDRRRPLRAAARRARLGRRRRRARRCDGPPPLRQRTAQGASRAESARRAARARRPAGRSARCIPSCGSRTTLSPGRRRCASAAARSTSRTPSTQDVLLGAACSCSAACRAAATAPSSCSRWSAASTRIERYDGVKARLGFDRWRVYRDPALRIDGSAALPVRVVGDEAQTAARRWRRPRSDLRSAVRLSAAPALSRAGSRSTAAPAPASRRAARPRPRAARRRAAPPARRSRTSRRRCRRRRRARR